ncbi:MAG TPA: divalent-cation tolerance protein CutA [Ktedonobacteraceae bacterium]|nr:divalent-cation tolerance protein CutA [Ktedonobacteraceae bacterium]
MTECIQVTTAIDSQAKAQQLAELLVKQRLAACVHVSGPITSTYWWQGKIEIAEEWMCSAKTLDACYPEVEAAIKRWHSYEEPEIVALPLLTGSTGYLDWIRRETREPEQSE